MQSKVAAKSNEILLYTLREESLYSEFAFLARTSRIRTEYGLIYSVNLRIQSECEKMLSGKTPNTDTFYAMTHSRSFAFLRKMKVLQPLCAVKTPLPLSELRKATACQNLNT